MNKEVYILSGLGADKRVFKNINLTGYNVTHLEWIQPMHDEPVEAYATRIRAGIHAPLPVLIGLSFGGIMAIEIAKQMPVEKVIIISSVKNKNEIPWYMRWAGTLRLHKIIPASMLKKPRPLLYWLFGTYTQSDQAQLQQILHDTDNSFLRWAMDVIVHWKQRNTLPGICHIHGTHDRIFPYRYMHCHHTIKGGGHFMVLDKAVEVTRILQEELG